MAWRGQTALMWAAAEDHAAVIRALIARGADVKARSNAGFTASLFAAREGRIAAVDALLAAGADMNESLPVRRRPQAAGQAAPPTNDVGLNAFLLAAANAHYELAAQLLDRGADPNAAPQGYTALHQVSWVRKAGIAGSKQPGATGLRQHGQLDLRAHARLERRATQRARHQTSEHGRDDAQFDWRVSSPPTAAVIREVMGSK
jgi:hypothetical protein